MANEKKIDFNGAEDVESAQVVWKMWLYWKRIL